ncbi:MAG: TIGR01548 family HAD-type hydrolase [Cyanobacteriota bacterium]|nr:TIGR01548 family HAD-type hydrolase [Cyanobacteriota bacterium]
MVWAIVVFDIDGVIRDVGGSYRRAIADTVERFTNGAFRPTMEDIDRLKSEGIWNNDWDASRELTDRYWESLGRDRAETDLDYNTLVDFFQSRYRGSNPQNWDGYITTEPLLLQLQSLETLRTNDIAWGFFSGAPRGEAEYVLKKRLGLENPVLVAMEDAPGKPDPAGLFAAVRQLEEPACDRLIPVVYVGDTVADMYTVEKAKTRQSDRAFVGIGVLPPHVRESDRAAAYAAKLKEAGAAIVLENVQELTRDRLEQVLNR